MEEDRGYGRWSQAVHAGNKMGHQVLTQSFALVAERDTLPHGDTMVFRTVLEHVIFAGSDTKRDDTTYTARVVLSSDSSEISSFSMERSYKGSSHLAGYDGYWKVALHTLALHSSKDSLYLSTPLEAGIVDSIKIFHNSSAGMKTDEIFYSDSIASYTPTANVRISLIR